MLSVEHETYCRMNYCDVTTGRTYDCNCGAALTDEDEAKPLYAGWAGSPAPYPPELGR